MSSFAPSPADVANRYKEGTLIGLDIGGSKTRGIKVANNVVVADGQVGSANVQNTSRREAREQLAKLFCQLDTRGVTRIIAGAGGIDTDADKIALASLIRACVPNASITVVHDSRLLLAAAGAPTGIAVIAGTGSAAWGINSVGLEARAGGWGYLLGDEGSGYWFGREAVRLALHRMNLGAEPDQLTQALLARCELTAPEQLIHHFHSDLGRDFWASLSPVVFEAATLGDDRASELIDRGAKELTQIAVQVATRLELDGPVIVGGGLGLNQPALMDAFAGHAGAAGLTNIRALDTEPVFGTLTIDDRSASAP
ncbi:N-acetylglucosamine kinase-like BadF-type ATPase [Arthrobacter sp. AG258]|uniref:N-acetylglucosamine kinase n=1 Tax=Arthrobacter sp. AG258 TaxID=2183899 RepID=UPI00105FC028|nr:BadF/BadG/BcrA/BcrD ATPase family protein [Arthrobacter sp. AG258]TDT74675.1 N-acetylglucosamine kinase-like BadF-type ATPase [Arthrobacter sp. AG258]